MMKFWKLRFAIKKTLKIIILPIQIFHKYFQLNTWSQKIKQYKQKIFNIL
jgi:hypothetical protein